MLLLFMQGIIRSLKNYYANVIPRTQVNYLTVFIDL